MRSNDRRSERNDELVDTVRRYKNLEKDDEEKRK
jgi:hypothetical protein